MGHLHDAGVVLMHSTPNGIGGCPQALQRLISYYKAAGYKFVTVSSNGAAPFPVTGDADMRAERALHLFLCVRGQSPLALLHALQ